MSNDMMTEQQTDELVQAARRVLDSCLRLQRELRELAREQERRRDESRRAK